MRMSVRSEWIKGRVKERTGEKESREGREIEIKKEECCIKSTSGKIAFYEAIRNYMVKIVIISYSELRKTSGEREPGL